MNKNAWLYKPSDELWQVRVEAGFAFLIISARMREVVLASPQWDAGGESEVGLLSGLYHKHTVHDSVLLLLSDGYFLHG